MQKELNFEEFESLLKEDWIEKVTTDLKGKAYESLFFETDDKLEIEPFYTKEDSNNEEFPLSPKNWSIRQNFEPINLKIGNTQILDSLNGGVNAIGIFSVFTGDLTQLLENVQCDYINLHFGGYIFPGKMEEVLALYQKPEEAQGTFDNTPLFDGHTKTSEFDDGFWDMLEFTSKHLPNFKSILVDVSSVLNDGGNTSQEIGIALAHGNEYIISLLDKGYSLEMIANNIHFKFAIGSSYFIEISKIRAFRWAWNNLLNSYRTSNSDENLSNLPATHIHCETSTWNKSVKDVHNNMLRSTTESMSAVLGGADSISVKPYDELYHEKSDFSLRIARNTLNIIKEEAYFETVQDIAGGSYYIETLTSKYANLGWEFFQEVEKQGGAIKATENSWIKQNIKDSEKLKKEAFLSGKKVLLGVNKYEDKNSTSIEPLENINRLERKDA